MLDLQRMERLTRYSKGLTPWLGAGSVGTSEWSTHSTVAQKWVCPRHTGHPLMKTK